MKRLQIDQENNAERWWDYARRAADRMPTDGSRVFDALNMSTRTSGVFVTDGEAQAFLVWAATLPGWTGGPEHAPHPVIVHDVDPRELTADELESLIPPAVLRSAQGHLLSPPQCPATAVWLEAARAQLPPGWTLYADTVQDERAPFAAVDFGARRDDGRAFVNGERATSGAREPVRLHAYTKTRDGARDEGRVLVPGGLLRACEWCDGRIAKLDAKAAS